MAYKSGWCGNDNHGQCRVISRNGIRAMQRYALCTCTCHDGSDEAFAIVAGGLKEWDVPPPASASLQDLVWFVDAVNRKASPGDYASFDEDSDDQF